MFITNKIQKVIRKWDPNTKVPVKRNQNKKKFNSNNN